MENNNTSAEKESSRSLMLMKEGNGENSNGDINEEQQQEQKYDHNNGNVGYARVRNMYEQRLMKVESTPVVRMVQLARLQDKSYIPHNPNPKQPSPISFLLSAVHKLPIVSPQSIPLLLWYRIPNLRNILILLITIFQLLEIPIAIFFTSEVYKFQTGTNIGLVINILCLILLYFDAMVVRFCVPYYYKGKLVADRMSIVGKYVGKEGVMNFVALLALTVYIGSGVHQLVYLKIVFCLKMYSLRQLDRQIMHVLEFMPIPYAIYRLAKLLILLWVFCSIAGSIYFAIDHTYYLQQGPYYNSGQLWLTNSLAVGQLSILTNNGWFVWYSYALYWAIQTASTVGYGDITPANPPEVVFVILVILFMTILFAFYVNTIWRILGDLASNRIQGADIWRKYKNYMRSHKDIPSVLKYRISNCLYQLQQDRTNQQIQQSLLTPKITPSLRQQFHIEYKQPFYQKIPLFKALDCEALTLSEVMGDFVAIIEGFNAEEGRVVYREGQWDQYLYYVRKGEIGLEIGGAGLGRTVGEDECFGVEGFFRRRARNHTATTLAFTKTWRISYSNLQSTLHKHSYLNQQFHQLQYHILVDKSPMFLSLPCWKCRSKFHFLDECPQIMNWRDKLGLLQVNARDLGYTAMVMVMGWRQEREGYVRAKVRSEKVRGWGQCQGEGKQTSRWRGWTGSLEKVQHFRYYFPTYNISE